MDFKGIDDLLKADEKYIRKAVEESEENFKIKYGKEKED